MVRRWPVFGVGLGVLWLFVRGPPLTPEGLLAEFLPGVVFGLPVAYLLRNFYTARLNLTGAVTAIPPTVAYAALFGKELLTANVDVAYRVLAPSMPIEPAVVEVPLRVQSDLAITTIANSITLTPGTLTVRVEGRSLTVHTLMPGAREDLFDGGLERGVRFVFYGRQAMAIGSPRERDETEVLQPPDAGDVPESGDRETGGDEP